MSSSTSINPNDIPPMDVYRLLSNTIIPRPIAWIGTLSPGGTANLAPFSFFNVFAHDPPLVAFSSAGHNNTRDNLAHLAEFTVSMTCPDQAVEVERSAARFPKEISEFDWLEVNAVPSTRIAPPYVSGAPAAFECELHDQFDLSAEHRMFIGKVVMIHVDQTIAKAGRIEGVNRLPLGRVGSRYVTLPQPFSVERPTWESLQEGDATRSS